MPAYAIARAAAAASGQHATFRQPQPIYTSPPGLEDVAKAVIGPDEQVTEREAIRRFEALAYSSDPRVLVNGTSHPIAACISRGYFRWASYPDGILERYKAPPRPFVRVVYKPAAPASPAEKTLRTEIRELREMLTGSVEVGHISVAEGHKLVINASKFAVNIHALRHDLEHGEVLSGQILELDADTADAVTGSGILQLISIRDAQDLIAAA